MSIGWVKLSDTPGNSASTSRSCCSSTDLSDVFRSSTGFSTRNVSLWLGPIGSRPSSSEPVRATMPVTSGTLARIAD
jgi:hypothetical protein